MKNNKTLFRIKAKKSAGEKISELNITSLVDILTIMLLFLIQNISMDTNKKTMAAGIKPPSSVSKDQLIDKGNTYLVKFLKDRIEFAQDEVISYNDFMSNTDTSRQKRTEIQNALKYYAQDKIKLENNPSMLIQADESIPCSAITFFLRFSATSGFVDIFFATDQTTLERVLTNK